MSISVNRLVISLLAAAALSAAAAAGPAAAASPRSHSNAPARTTMSAVTISITQTGGTVWGKVTATYTYKHHRSSRSCGAASCTFHIPRGVTMHLSQVATNSSTWPFKDWTVITGHKTKTMMGQSATVKVTGALSITAVYVVSQSGYSSPGY